MRGTGTRVGLFVPLIWATWDRSPLLVGSLERRVRRAFEAKCVKLGVDLLALGGVAQLAAVHAYVLRQREHHAMGYLTPEWALEPPDRDERDGQP
ncbi:MAG TPA: hypothetical protein VKQ36_08670 [Ktedonobacterales bacterium]|nr:hypothetical protein [Ktedonobacterales bacterium]